MRRNRMLAGWLAGLASLLLAGPTVVQAQEMTYSELVSRLHALETELQSQRMQFASHSVATGAESFGCGSAPCGSGGGCCPTLCEPACAAWYAGYEVTFLRPHISDNEFGAGWSDDYGTGHRFVLGYDGGQGLGARLRYWFYNHGHDTAAGARGVGIDMDVLDAEFTLHEQLRNWDLTLSGGVRYGRMGFDFAGAAQEFYFEGVGPTVSLEAERGIGNRGLYLVGNFRTSLLYGELSGPTINPTLNGTADDVTTLVLENQLGVGWSRQYDRGQLNLRAVWESQYWYNASMGDDIYGFASAVGYSGPSLSLEFRY